MFIERVKRQSRHDVWHRVRANKFPLDKYSLWLEFG